DVIRRLRKCGRDAESGKQTASLLQLPDRGSYRRSVGLGSHVLAGLKVRHRSADFAWCQQDIRAIPIEAREIRGGVMDTLFGEGQSGLKVVLFVIVVLGLLALAFWLLRRV